MLEGEKSLKKHVVWTGRGRQAHRIPHSELYLYTGGKCCKGLDYVQEFGLWLPLPEKIAEKSPEKPNPAVSASFPQSWGPRADRCEAGVFLETCFLCSLNCVWNGAPGFLLMEGPALLIVKCVTGQEEVDLLRALAGLFFKVHGDSRG